MKPRVLIVDDSMTVRMHLQELFERSGFHPVAVPSLAAARTSLADGVYDLVVLDILLADGSGLDLLQELRADSATLDTPIMLLSTESDVADRVRGVHLGASEFVGKPYDPAHVASRAFALVRGRLTREAGDDRRTILVIDDSVAVRDAIRVQLEQAGHQVVTATSGEEGLALAASVRPDAIVVDAEMPGIDGSTVVRRVRLDPALRRTPCLLLTGSDLADETRALDDGADVYLRKGVDPEVLLARLAGAMRAVRSPAAVETGTALGPKRLLVIDDSLTFLHTLADALRGEGYDVVTAQSGPEALTLLPVQPVDCVLLDVIMPGMDGLQVCKQIKATAAWRDIPIIMLTGLQEKSSMIAGINVGADDYIVKVDDFEIVKARVRAQLRRKQFEDENRSVREQLHIKELEATHARAAQETARRESLFKSRFLANMSHELRTPLNAVIGFSELLLDEVFGPLNEKQRLYVAHIQSGGRHLLTLINDILDLSRIEAGRLVLQRAPSSVQTLVRSVEDVANALAVRQQVTCEFIVPPGLPDVHVDGVRVKQVLFNLLSNAIKFTPSGGRVTLRAESDGRWVRLHVEDTGVGIRAEDLPRLFREFEQIEPTSGVKPEGTGLGLALTRKLVEAHGGRVEVRSTPGQGSTFTVELPVVGIEPTETTTPAHGNVAGGRT